MPRRKTTSVYVNRRRLRAGLAPIAVRTHAGVAYARAVTLVAADGTPVAELRLDRGCRLYAKHSVSVALRTRLKVEVIR